MCARWACVALLLSFAGAQAPELPPYIKQCRSDDAELPKCLLSSIEHIRPYLAAGIPDINLPSTEPFRMDQLSLSLTDGPNGYKVTLKDIDVYGASNFTPSYLRLSDGKKPFEAHIVIPRLKIDAKYSSSGILIILPASGNGTFTSRLSDVSTVVRGAVSIIQKDGVDFLHVDQLTVDLEVKGVTMQVKRVFNNNRILTEATNLFLRENASEILKVMMPQLKKKLAQVFKRIGNQIFERVPLPLMYLKV